MNISILCKFLHLLRVLKWVILILVYTSINSTFHAQKMMQGSVSTLGVNMKSEANQMSIVVGDINNEFRNYSDKSISSGFIHTSLIYRFEEEEEEEDEEEDEDNGYSIFPNPTSNEIQILFGKAIEYNYKIRVFDAIGRLVIDDMILKNSFGIMLDFSSFAKGVYSIQKPQKENILEKIVKN